VFPSNLEYLRELNLRGCNIDDTNLALLLASPAGSSLQSLLLGNATKITGRFLLEVPSVPALTELDLRLTQLDDATLMALLSAERLPSLTSLDVSQCGELVRPRVSHPSLRRFSALKCRSLSELVFLACPALEHLNASLNFALSTLDLSGCDGALLGREHIDTAHSAIRSFVPPGMSSGAAAVGNMGAAGTAAAAAPGSRQGSAPSSPLRMGAAPGSGAVVPPLPLSEMPATRPHGGGYAYSTAAYREYRSSLASSFSSSFNMSPSSGSPPRPGATRPLTGMAALSLGASAAPGAAGSPARRGRGLEASGTAGASSSSSSSSSVRRSSLGSGTGTSSSASSALPAPSSLPFSPNRSIRSVEQCVGEERVRELEAKLLAEQMRLSQLQAWTQALAASAAQNAAAASAQRPLAQQQQSASDLKNATVTCYGLKKQLAVAKAKLKKEQRDAEAAAAAAETAAAIAADTAEDDGAKAAVAEEGSSQD